MKKSGGVIKRVTDLKLLFWALLGFCAYQLICKEAVITYFYECASHSFVLVFVY